MFMFWQFSSSWPLSCRGHSCRPPTMWLQKLASIYEVLYWWADLFPLYEYAPPSFFHLSYPLCKNSVNSYSLREDDYIFMQKTGNSNTTAKLMAAILLPKNRTIIMICRSVTLTLHTYKHIFAKSVSNLEISSIILPLYLLMSYSIWLQQSYQPYPCPSYVLLGHCTCNMILNIYALLQRTLCFFPQTV